MNDEINKMPTTIKPNRKASKPMMEKRRRARINQSLSELKDLVTCSSKYEINNCRRSKLEKADILEMTVRHLHYLHHRAKHGGHPPTAEGNEDHLDKFRAGFHECVNEVNRYLNEKHFHLDGKAHNGLTTHLNTRLNHLHFANNGSRGRTTEGDKMIPAGGKQPDEDNNTDDNRDSPDEYHNGSGLAYGNQCATKRTFSGLKDERGQQARNSPLHNAHMKAELGGRQMGLRPPEVELAVWRPW